MDSTAYLHVVWLFVDFESDGTQQQNTLKFTVQRAQTIKLNFDADETVYFSINVEFNVSHVI